MNTATNNPHDPFVTKSMLDAQFEKAESVFVTKSMLDARIEKTEAWVKDRFDMVDYRFGALEQKMDERFATMDKKFDYVIGVLDSYLKKMEDKDTEDAARDAQLGRHDRWHRQTASALHLKLR